MKKPLLLFAFFTAVFQQGKAQKPDTAHFILHYKFSHLRDTTNPQTLYHENMMLLVGKTATAYKSYDTRLADEDAKKQIEAQVIANGPAGGRIMVNRRDGGSNTEYYFFPAENKFVRREKLLPRLSYLVDEAMPAIDWHITTDTASFGGYRCQKATAHFKGRDYTAWFSPDIAMHSGPWKLMGLPGLILEASDTKKQVVFTFDGFEDLNKSRSAAAEPDVSPGLLGNLLGKDANADPRVIALPTDGIKTTAAEFDKLKEALRKDPNAFMQSQMAAAGNIDPHAPPRHFNIKLPPEPIVSNPIELSEKK